jgi:protoheme IX farnesyltransferase
MAPSRLVVAVELLIQEGPPLSLRGRVLTYYEFTKPKIWYLLVFTSLTATYIGAATLGLNPPLGDWLLIGTAITAGCAGCNALTNYHDRDIDAVMLRTRHRPLPSGRLSPVAGLTFGLVLVSVSLALSAFLNLLSLLWMALGILDNVLVYSILLKRRNPLNIVLGGFSGGLPVLFGWSAITPGPVGSISLLPLLIAGLVFLWIPIHIWFLAVSYKSDYARAEVPMLPVVIGTEPALRIITLFSLVFLPFSLAIYFVGHFGIVYAVTAIIGGVANLVGSVYVLSKPTETHAWRMFKISSPYLFLLFIGMIIDVTLRA